MRICVVPLWQVFVSYFEIYGGRCQDLLNSRQRLNVREDGAGDVVVSDLMELQAGDADALHGIIETGNRNRTTHATESNDESSRSHAICTSHPLLLSLLLCVIVISTYHDVCHISIDVFYRNR